MGPGIVWIELERGIDMHCCFVVMTGHGIGPRQRAVRVHIGWVNLHCLAGERYRLPFAFTAAQLTGIDDVLGVVHVREAAIGGNEIRGCFKDFEELARSALPMLETESPDQCLAAEP